MLQSVMVSLMNPDDGQKALLLLFVQRLLVHVSFFKCAGCKVEAKRTDFFQSRLSSGTPGKNEAGQHGTNLDRSLFGTVTERDNNNRPRLQGGTRGEMRK